jgi:hypothetical protein
MIYHPRMLYSFPPQKKDVILIYKYKIVNKIRRDERPAVYYGIHFVFNKVQFISTSCSLQTFFPVPFMVWMCRVYYLLLDIARRDLLRYKHMVTLSLQTSGA